jgi:hypothetical protein
LRGFAPHPTKNFFVKKFLDFKKLEWAQNFVLGKEKVTEALPFAFEKPLPTL